MNKLYLVLFSLCYSITLFACTGMQIRSKDYSFVNGRTVEFGMSLDLSLISIGRGENFSSLPMDGKGFQYSAKYGVIGAISFDFIAVMDGMNEKGLSGGIFYFPGFASYEKLDQNNEKKAISAINFLNWVLTQFATVAEVRENIKNVVIADVPVPNWGKTSPPFHYIVYDKEGNSLVIEPLNGQLVVYDNPIGTITNAPTFDWHMENLRNYVNLKVDNIEEKRLGTLILKPFGQGSGMHGLPGDFTPVSRFVRAALISSASIPVETSQEAVYTLFHLLHQFDIPKGISRELKNGRLEVDYTMFTSVKDPTQLKYYFTTYKNQAMQMIDMNKIDFNQKAILHTKTNQEQKVEEVMLQVR